MLLINNTKHPPPNQFPNQIPNQIQNQIQNQLSSNQLKKKRKRFEEYIKFEDVQKFLNEGILKKGKLKINKYNRKESHVILESKEKILIENEILRNRALDEDVVVIEILEDSNNKKLKGKVVYILEKSRRQVVGNLEMIKDSTKYYSFIPKDKKYPKMLIPTSDIDFQIRKDELYLVKLSKWTSDSVFPIGRFIKCIGKEGDIECEIERILIENCINFNHFPSKFSKMINKFKITENEMKRRLDLRKCRIFTIDPEDSNDLDDAISIKHLNSAFYEIGIHISDVSHFIEPFTPLDEEAKFRGTSIYLENSIIPMLPKILSEDLFSLLPGKDRLTFSIFVTLNINGEILNSSIQFKKTIINSCVKLNYHQVDEILNGEYQSIEHLHFKNELIKDLKILNKITQNLKNIRMKRGALFLKQVWKNETKNIRMNVGKNFGVNEGKNIGKNFGMNVGKNEGKNIGVNVGKNEGKNFGKNEGKNFGKNEGKNFGMNEGGKSKQLIEELMLLANSIVAHQIYQLPISLLRKHSRPQEEKFQKFVQFCKKFDINASSSILFNESIQNKNENLIKFINFEYIKIMENAEYTMDNRDTYHYALNMPYYTHFTSPIRRYSDILVHRLLDSKLKKKSIKYSRDAFQQMIQHLNERYSKSKMISLQIHQLSIKKEKIVEGIIVHVGHTKLKIFIPKYGMEYKIQHFDHEIVNKKVSKSEWEISYKKKEDEIVHRKLQLWDTIHVNTIVNKIVLL